MPSHPRPLSSPYLTDPFSDHIPPCRQIVIPPPHPLHLVFAVVLGLVEATGGTGGVVDKGRGLEAVGEDDAGVHGCDVDVVDVGGFHALGSIAEEF